MLATMVLAACSSDDTTEPVVNRGMVLKANVEDTDTRATITDNEGTWKFAFATGDVIKVSNNKVTKLYTFKNNGTEFASTDALQTTTAANWYAYFPGETINLANQSGAFADVANKYALAGATAAATTGSNGLFVTMKANAAVLRIVSVKNGENFDISVKTDDGMYVLGLEAVKNSADFSVQKSDTKVTLLTKSGADAGVVYYVVVPAGVKLSVYNGKTLRRTTKTAGLTAGKYYTLTTGDTEGTATATINGVEKKKDWVQLWAGGPKFAKENVADKLNWSDAVNTTGDAYVWGANWRTPTKEELTFITEHTCTPINAKAEVTVQNGVPGILYTGIQPGYTDKSIFLPSSKGNEGYFEGVYWTSTDGEPSNGVSLNFVGGEGALGMYYFDPKASTQGESTKHFVRPVLAE